MKSVLSVSIYADKLQQYRQRSYYLNKDQYDTNSTKENGKNKNTDNKPQVNYLGNNKWIVNKNSRDIINGEGALIIIVKKNITIEIT